MAYYNYYEIAANENTELATKLRSALVSLGLTVTTLDFSAVSGNFVLATDGNENEVFKWTTSNEISVCGQTVSVSNLMIASSPISIAGTAHAVCLMSAQGTNLSPCREVIIIAKSGTSYMGFAAWTTTEGGTTWESIYVYNMDESYNAISLAPTRSAGNPICGFSLGTINGQYLNKCYYLVYAPPLGTTGTGTVAGTPSVIINGYILMMD